MKKSDEQERNIANRLYNLDKKVYETTGSTLGRVFPSSPSFALEKIIDALKINREYFLKNEMTLIANMIGTIRDEEKANTVTWVLKKFSMPLLMASLLSKRASSFFSTRSIRAILSFFWESTSSIR